MPCAGRPHFSANDIPLHTRTMMFECVGCDSRQTFDAIQLREASPRSTEKGRKGWLYAAHTNQH